MEDAKKTRGLGKGLSELLGEARAKATIAKQTKVEPYSNIGNNNITPISNDSNAKKNIEQMLSQELDSLNNLSEIFDNTHNKNEESKTDSILNMPEKVDNINSIDANNTDDDFETIIAKSLDDIAILQDKPNDLVQNIQQNILDKNIFKNDTLIDNQYYDIDNHHNNIIHRLPIELVNPNKEQPRKFFDVNALNDLASSIKIYGVIQPILVNKIGHEYMIVAGERRWRASQIAELKTIPAIIANYKEDETLEIALIENIQRANLTPLDEAKAYYYLIHKYELTQNELAQKVGKSRSYVANMVRLLELEDSVKNYLETGELSVGHARVLIGVKNATDLADKIVKSNMSVRKVEELVSQSSQKQNVRLPKAFDTGKNTDILALEADLKAALGVGVSINSQTSQKGSLVIRYESLEQLDEVCRRLCSNWGVDVA